MKVLGKKSTKVLGEATNQIARRRKGYSKRGRVKVIEEDSGKNTKREEESNYCRRGVVKILEGGRGQSTR